MVSLSSLLFHSFLSNCFLTQLPFTPPADNLTLNEQQTGPHAAGVNSILPKEHGSQFFYLPIIRHSEEEVSLDLAALLWSKEEKPNVLFSFQCFNPECGCNLCPDFFNSPGVSSVLLGLLHSRLGAPQSRHVFQRAYLPDRESHGAAQPPGLPGASAAQEDQCEHLQQAG